MAVGLNDANRQLWDSAANRQDHKNLHGVVIETTEVYERMGILSMMLLVALTVTDAKVADNTTARSLKTVTCSYSLPSGEYTLTKEFLQRVFGLAAKQGSEYSDDSVISESFLRNVCENSASSHHNRLKLHKVPHHDDLVIMHTCEPSNRAYLPLIFSLAMSVSCPFNGPQLSASWIMNKDVLYLIAAALGILQIDFPSLFFRCLKQDIFIVSLGRFWKCAPLWRSIFSIPRSRNDVNKISSMPKFLFQVVDISTYLRIVERSIEIDIVDEETREKHQARLMNTYYGAPPGQPSRKMVSMLLMFESHKLNEAVLIMYPN